jgi:hypothetical protein
MTTPPSLGINGGFTCDLAAADAALARGMAERNRLSDKTNENPRQNDKERTGGESGIRTPFGGATRRQALMRERSTGFRADLK